MSSYYAKNRLALLIYEQLRWLAFGDEMREGRRLRYQRRLSKERAYEAAYRAANRERIRQYHAEYRAANRERINQLARAGHKRRSPSGWRSWKERNVERVKGYRRAWAKRDGNQNRPAAELQDCYIRAKLGLPKNLIPQSLIDAKRAELQLRRALNRKGDTQ